MSGLSGMRWTVDYSSSFAPSEYRCGGCGAEQVKLWRVYNTFLNHQTLECADCAGKSQGKDVTSIDDDGKVLDAEIDMRCDQIGWRIPAVPTAEGDTFWGYSSVPGPAVEWWRRLPTRATQAPSPAVGNASKGEP